MMEEAKQITLNGGRRVAMSSYKGQEYRVREEEISWARRGGFSKRQMGNRAAKPGGS